MKEISFIIMMFCFPLLYSQQDTVETYTMAEWPAVFEDDASMATWFNYLKTEVRKSEFSNIDSISGRVVVGFKIDSSGRMIDPWIERGLKPNYDAEAIRIVSNSPQWTPAMNEGQNVEVVMFAPVDFNITEEYDESSNQNRRKKNRKNNCR